MGFFLGVVFYEWRIKKKENIQEADWKKGVIIFLFILMSIFLLYISTMDYPEFQNWKCFSF